MRRGRVLAGEERQQVHAIQLRDGVLTRQSQRGGGDVQRADGSRLDLAARQHALPDGQERHADPPVGEHSLLADQRIVERTVPLLAPDRRAVVREDEQQRVLLHGVLAQELPDPPHSVVDGGDRRQGPSVASRPVRRESARRSARGCPAERGARSRRGRERRAARARTCAARGTRSRHPSGRRSDSARRGRSGAHRAGRSRPDRSSPGRGSSEPSKYSSKPRRPGAYSRPSPPSRCHFPIIPVR